MESGPKTKTPVGGTAGDNPATSGESRRGALERDARPPILPLCMSTEGDATGIELVTPTI
jgi:hypothetical protein